MKSQVFRRGNWAHSFGIVFSLLCIVHSFAFGAGSDTVSVDSEVISFIVGESTIVSAPWPTVRVAVTDPSIAYAEGLTAQKVLLQGIKVGSTDLIVWNADETQVKQWKIHVRLDTDRFQQKLDELFPDAALEVDEHGETLIIKGLLRNADQAVQLHNYLEKTGTAFVDTTSIAGSQQVQIEIRVAEVSRQALRALGFNAFHTDDDYFGAMRIGSIYPVSMGPVSGQAPGDNTAFE